MLNKQMWKMDRRMDGWVGMWMDGWVRGWVGGWVDGWVMGGRCVVSGSKIPSAASSPPTSALGKGPTDKMGS